MSRVLKLLLFKSHILNLEKKGVKSYQAYASPSGITDDMIFPETAMVLTALQGKTAFPLPENGANHLHKSTHNSHAGV